jgi:hypothetical protein
MPRMETMTGIMETGVMEKGTDTRDMVKVAKEEDDTDGRALSMDDTIVSR